MIEEEEIRMLRKEMVPKAQLMPFFDRPFLPQRSVIIVIYTPPYITNINYCVRNLFLFHRIMLFCITSTYYKIPILFLIYSVNII